MVGFCGSQSICFLAIALAVALFCQVLFTREAFMMRACCMVLERIMPAIVQGGLFFDQSPKGLIRRGF
jgi:hypothetical protein